MKRVCENMISQISNFKFQISNIILIFISLYFSYASASYKSIKKVTFSSAYTLERGEAAVGIFGPIQYGIMDNVMISSHPLMLLFLTPNFFFKYKIIDKKIGFSLNTGYIETFLDPNRTNSPGSGICSATFSLPFRDMVSFNITSGYVFEISPIAHKISLSGAINLLTVKTDLISIQMHNLYSINDGQYLRPTVILMYSHAWEITRLNLGLAYGNYTIQTGEASLDIKEVSFYPIIDVWWQF